LGGQGRGTQIQVGIERPHIGTWTGVSGIDQSANQ
jgi:hypothetical protein